MRTAILLSGHFRTFKKTNKNFYDKFINNLEDYDIFINSWDVDGKKKKLGGYVNLITKNKIEVNDVQKDIQKVYKPKILEIEKNKNFKTTAQQIIDKNPNLKTMTEKFSQKKIKGSQDFNLSNYIECILGQFYKIQKCYQMIESPEEYDVIAKYRFDLKLSRKFEWDHKLKKGVFVGGKGKTYFDGRELWRDSVIVGRSEIMRRICHAYDYIVNLESNPTQITTIHAINSILKKHKFFDKFTIIKDSESALNNIEIVR